MICMYMYTLHKHINIYIYVISIMILMYTYLFWCFTTQGQMVGPPNAWPAPGLAWWQRQVFARTSRGGGSAPTDGRKVGCNTDVTDDKYLTIY